MGGHAHGGKIAYSWIFPHPAKGGLILGGGVVFSPGIVSHRRHHLGILSMLFIVIYPIEKEGKKEVNQDLMNLL